MLKQLVFILFFVLYLSTSASAQIMVGATAIDTATLTANLRVPWALVWGPDDFIWMTERHGRISRVNPANGQLQPLLTVSEVAEAGEGGMLGLALHPDFNIHPYVYVVYTYNSAAGLREKLVRYTYAAQAATLSAPFTLLDHIPASTNHNGSSLLILPDNTLLMTTGDAGNAAAAQNMNSLNGKMLRLNLDGSIPADNPISGSYIYSWGHRNPQGLVQAPNGSIYSSEHGPATDDELNRILPNRNYGWPDVHGFCDTPAEQSYCTANNVAEPLAAYTPTIAVSGIAYYNSPAIPDWQHSVLMLSLNGRRLVQLKLNVSGDAVVSQEQYLHNALGRLRSICTSPAGKVYIATSNRDGRGTPATPDDRILVLENRNFTATPTAAEKSQIHLLPNPAHRQALLTSVNLPLLNAELIDLAGRKVLQPVMKTEKGLAISLEGLAQGLYLVKVQHPKGYVVKKLLVE